MKRVLNGRIYDTEKAQLVGWANNIGKGADSIRDFNHWSAGLYKTPRSGRFFLAGEGGPMTRWAVATGSNSWSGSEGVFPLNPNEALEWAENYLEAEVIELFFDVNEA